jgi:hypothetical protein
MVASYCSGVADAIMSTGFESPAAGGRKARNRSTVGPESSERRRPRASQASASKMPGPPAFGDDANAGTRWKRLHRQERRDVEKLLHRVRPQHACLLEQRIDGGVEASERRGVARRSAHARGGAAGLDGDDGLLPRDLGRDPGELPGVTEALEVKDDHVSAGILGPVGEEVVARYVRLVADRHERRDSEAGALQVVEDGDAKRSALA